MDIAIVFDWFAQESTHAAEQTKEPKQREILLKLALMWAAAAQRCHDEPSTPPNTDVLSRDCTAL
jgi:hypothetical protein